MGEDPEEVIERVGRRIAELRVRAKLTQAEVAEALDTTVNNFQRIEHGLQNLTIRTLVRIAKVLGVSVIEIFKMPAPKSSRVRGRPRARRLT